MFEGVLVFSACCWYLSIHLARGLVMAQIWKKFSQFSHKACLGGWWVSSKCFLSVARSGQSTVQKWHLALSENNTRFGLASICCRLSRRFCCCICCCCCCTCCCISCCCLCPKKQCYRGLVHPDDFALALRMFHWSHDLRHKMLVLERPIMWPKDWSALQICIVFNCVHFPL